MTKEEKRSLGRRMLLVGREARAPFVPTGVCEGLGVADGVDEDAFAQGFGVALLLMSRAIPAPESDGLSEWVLDVECIAEDIEEADRAEATP